MSSIYLDRYAWQDSVFMEGDFKYRKNTGIIVVIPCFNEPDLLNTLKSLAECSPTSCFVEVFVVINASIGCSDDITEKNLQTLRSAHSWISGQSFKHKQIDFHVKIISLDQKNAGVGLARKIGMDDAVRYFEKIKKPDGIILCYDADSACDPDYLIATETYFKNHPKCPGASIYFEHPLEGDLSPDNYEAIINYELFLRYYINVLVWAGFPYAHQTIGSSMCVKSDVYQKQGGMNKRKAGEDFYFLNKIIPLGEFGNIQSTRVIPSARTSDRVPFGTGKDISVQLMEQKVTCYETYHPKIFEDLRIFLTGHSIFFKDKDELNIPGSMASFLELNNFQSAMTKIRKQSPNIERFSHNFFEWMNAFRILKYVHHARDHYYPNIEIKDATMLLCKQWLGIQTDTTTSKKQLLLLLRQHDRSQK